MAQPMNMPPPPPPPPPAPAIAAAPTNRRAGGRFAAIVITLAAAILFWQAGTFDRALVNVGMNAKPCIQNGFGATFCGDAAKSYCQSTERLRRLANASDDCDAVMDDY